MYNDPNATITVTSVSYANQTTPLYSKIMTILASKFRITFEVSAVILDTSPIAQHTTPTILLQTQQNKFQKAVQNGNLTTTLHNFASSDGSTALSTATGVTATVTAFLPSSAPTGIPSTSKSLSWEIIVGITIGAVALSVITCAFFYRRKFRSTKQYRIASAPPDEEIIGNGGYNTEFREVDVRLDFKPNNIDRKARFGGMDYFWRSN